MRKDDLSCIRTTLARCEGALLAVKDFAPGSATTREIIADVRESMRRIDRDADEPGACPRCAAIDARTEALKQFPQPDRSLPNDDPEPASREASSTTEPCPRFQADNYEPDRCIYCGRLRKEHAVKSGVFAEILSHHPDCSFHSTVAPATPVCDCGAVNPPPCGCLVRDKEPSAYHNVKCPRFVEGKL
jgi:hypothetical protein